MPITPESHSRFVAVLILSCLIGLHREELIRTVISRAYYSAFIKARGFAGMAHVIYGVHTKVRKYFRNSGKSGEAVLRDLISAKMEKLFNLRVLADYKFNADVQINQAEKALELMEEIMRLIDQLEALPQG